MLNTDTSRVAAVVGLHDTLTIVTRFVTLVAISLALVSCSTGPGSLGHGYRIVPRTVNLSGVPDAFEGLTHYTDLYLHSHRLGTVGEYSISPSGRFALFQDDGKTLLFDRGLRQTRDVSDGNFAVAKSFDWSEITGIVYVEYYYGHSPSKIQIVR
jgi:hypothetical protein